MVALLRRTRLILLFLIISLSNCEYDSKDYGNQLKEQKIQLDLITDEISLINDCKVSYKNIIKNDKTILIIDMECMPENDFLPGFILYKIYDELKKLQISHDSYKLSINSTIILDLDKSNLEFIWQQKDVFTNHSKMLMNKKFDEIYNLLSPDIKTLTYKEFTKYLNTIIGNTEYDVFEGFRVFQDKNTKYVFYRISKGTKYILLSYKFMEKGSPIYFIELI